MGGASQRQRVEDNTPIQEHITHSDTSLTGHTVFTPTLPYSSKYQTVLVTESEKATWQTWDNCRKEVMALGYSTCMHINEYDTVFC